MKRLFIILCLFFSISFSYAQEVEKYHIITNHEILPDLLDEFYDAARYYKVDFRGRLANIKKIELVTADFNFLGSVTENGSILRLNSELTKYPNLMRVVFFQEMGVIYGLEQLKTSKLYFMSNRWEMNPIYEAYAYRLRQSHAQKRDFFRKLAAKHPLHTQL
jgi:hypothetical protein